MLRTLPCHGLEIRWRNRRSWNLRFNLGVCGGVCADVAFRHVHAVHGHVLSLAFWCAWSPESTSVTSGWPLSWNSRSLQVLFITVLFITTNTFFCWWHMITYYHWISLIPWDQPKLLHSFHLFHVWLSRIVSLYFSRCLRICDPGWALLHFVAFVQQQLFSSCSAGFGQGLRAFPNAGFQLSNLPTCFLISLHSWGILVIFVRSKRYNLQIDLGPAILPRHLHERASALSQRAIITCADNVNLRAQFQSSGLPTSQDSWRKMTEHACIWRKT